MSRIYLDTCIVIYLIEKDPAYFTQIEDLNLGQSSNEFCFSPLVEMECLVMPLRKNDEPVKKLFQNFFGAHCRQIP